MQQSQVLRWLTPSEGPQDSMPIGGAGLGLNVWFERGELLIYFQLSGTFDEHNAFPKLGRLRISHPQGIWNKLKDFEQVLDVDKAKIAIRFEDGDGVQTKLEIWVDVFQPVFHIEHCSSQEQKLIVAYESWRYKDKISPAQDENTYIFTDRNDIFGYWMYPKDLTRHKDMLEATDNGVYWFHQNDNSDLGFDKEMDQQGFAKHKASLYNPQRDLIFGGYLTGMGMQTLDCIHGEYLGVPFKAARNTVLSSEATTSISVYCLSEQHPSIGAWKNKLSSRMASYQSLGLTQQRSKTRAWWHSFWQRSWINIQAKTTDQVINAEISQVSRNYRLFRFMQGFNVNADFALKFNGGSLTVDACKINYGEDRRKLRYVQEAEAQKALMLEDATQIEANENLKIDRDFGPDYRAWGGGSLTLQNQRLLYWPLLKSGDFDLFEPQLNWFVDTLPAAQLRSELAFGHGGASFTEQINSFGIPIGSHFGWKRPEGMGLGEQINRSCDDHYSTQLEFAFLMLEFHRYSGQNIDKYIPFIESSAEFFFAHYQQLAKQQARAAFDENGHLIVYPSSGLESYKDAKNPNDVTCGLRAIYQGLLEQSNNTEPKRQFYSERLAQIPPLIEREYKGFQTISPAYDWSEINNVELPQMYPVFPYQEYGVGRDGLQVARDTWEHSCNEIYGQRSYASWHQDGIFCAHLGLVEEAIKLLTCKMGDGPHRFPAFWGPGHDWTPDHNWGGTGMIQLQEMLVQDKAGKIMLLPCWPKDWDVHFKLALGHCSSIECQVIDGQITQLKVSPEHRLEAVVTDFPIALDDLAIE